MRIPIYQIDAFTKVPFAGNPAAICPLEQWLEDDVMQAIAAENNLAETTFFVSEGSSFRLRWFTPTVEVDLCGHATLATAHVILNHLMLVGREVQFETRSGTLQVWRNGDGLAMNFPATPPEAPMPSMAPLADVVSAMGAAPQTCLEIREIHGAPYLLFVFESEARVAALSPNFSTLRANVIATAPGDDVDFVSRFFAPMSGINEDPVTGSAHCVLAPYWSKWLDKSALAARQISARGGDVGCRVEGDRVILSGHCAFFMEGQIDVPGQVPDT